MRVVLFTGKGGVGKTTVAAATGLCAARSGRKTLVVSADPAHSLADALGVRVGPEPSEVDAGLYALQVDTQRRFEQSWSQVRGYLLAVLARGGAVDDLRAEELTVLPGADEIFALLELRDQVANGRFDAVLVDCAPTADTLRLLALPEALSWYMERVFPTHRRVMRSVRPFLGRATADVLPRDGVLAAVSRLHAELGEVQELLRAALTSVRMVLTPESVVVAEARRTLTSLALYGYQVDSVVVNRVFPRGGPWLDGWAAAQQRHLEEARESFAGLALRTVPYRPAEPVGAPALLDLGRDLYAGVDPLELPESGPVLRVERDGEQFVLALALPLADLADLALARSGDELVITVAGRRRVLALPSVLRRCTVSGARFVHGTLRIRFRPDPAQWPAQWAGRPGTPAPHAR